MKEPLNTIMQQPFQLMRLARLIPLILLFGTGCEAQPRQQMQQQTNPLFCDPQTGICEMPGSRNDLVATRPAAMKKPVRLICFTDPICSSCWGIEPQLRRLKLEYGADIEIEYRMGGLLPDWSYNSGGISKPSDVASHWDEASHHYQMPIDGDVWLEDPLSSSYPPSIAFKAAQLQDEEKARQFLRSLRELVFVKKQNITRWPVIAAAATAAGLDTARLKTDFEGRAVALFEDDLKLARQMGVRGFPSIFIAGEDDKSAFIYGSKPYAEFEAGVTAVYSRATRKVYDKSWDSLFAQHPTLATKEFAVLSDLSYEDAGARLEQLYKAGKLSRLMSKNGPLWSLK